jgi:electron transport complex protein RnfC
VPTLYPAGGAKQLIRVLTGKEVPASKRSTDLGVQCFNVATAYTAWRAIAHGEPVISRIVTLTGNVEQPRNWEVLIGTPIRTNCSRSASRSRHRRLSDGRPDDGLRNADLAGAPMVKATNCIIAGSPTLFPPKAPEMPCIRCGACAEACPHELQPFEMYWFSRAKNFGKTQEYNIFDCIECGCCSYVCPSHIPLVQYFRFAKSEIWAREREKNAADAAKARFEFRNERDEREKAEKAERWPRPLPPRRPRRPLKQRQPPPEGKRLPLRTHPQRPDAMPRSMPKKPRKPPSPPPWNAPGPARSRAAKEHRQPDHREQQKSPRSPPSMRARSGAAPG